MPFSDDDLGKLLIEQSYLSPEDLAKAQEDAKLHQLTLKQALFEMGLLTQDLLESAMAEHFQLVHFDLEHTQVTAELMSALPEEIARTFQCVIVARDEQGVTVATADPTRPNLEEALRQNIDQNDALLPAVEGAIPDEKVSSSSFNTLLNRIGAGKTAAVRSSFSGQIVFVYAPQSAIDALLVHYRKPLASRFQEIIQEKRKPAPILLQEIITDAFQLRASDIHFEPQEKNVVVRFRVDGVLHEVGRLPKEQYEGVVNRIKIEGNMRIDEHYAAQDGALRVLNGGETMDVRVSIVPVVDGEKVVMRVLSSYVRTITLSDLGFEQKQQDVLTKAAFQPFGMLLTVGPTGAGKSTTLYALVKLRNHPDVNISTIEDPVEYKVPGVNHIQVNPKANLTFASGLRSLVRQDPD